jgi:hypothetical protein
LEMEPHNFAQASLNYHPPILCWDNTLMSTRPTLVEMKSHKLFGLVWPGTVIFHISLSQVARIISVSYLHQAQLMYWDGGLAKFLPGLTLNQHPLISALK